MITCTNLSLKYGKKTTLTDVTFKALNGEILVVLGKNGSGKTSLMKCLAGVQKKYSGKISVCDVDGFCKDIRKLPQKTYGRLTSMLPQLLPNPAISAEALAEMGRFPYSKINGALSENDIKKVSQAFSFTKTEYLKDKLLCHMSGGERQMAYITMIMAQDTENVLLDEPAASLDTIYRKEVLDIAESLKAKGKCIIISIHDIDDAMRIADKILVIDDKKSVFWGTKESFEKTDILKDVFKVKKLYAKDSDGTSYEIYKGI